MDSKVDIWMPLSIGDYLADTSHLDTTQHGAYLLLLMHYWRKGPLPNDPVQLANIAKLSKEDWNMNQSVLLEFFHVGEDGLLHQKRQDVERAKALTQKQRGVQGAQAKWGTKNSDGQTKIARSQRLSEARQKGTHTEEEWVRLQAFCRHQCMRCHASNAPLVKAHIVPIYQGGSDSIENIQPLCQLCSSKKGFSNVDYRPDGWLNACKTHAKCMQNAWTLPLPSQVPLPSPSNSPAPSPLLVAEEGVEKSAPRSGQNAFLSPAANASLKNPLPISDQSWMIARAVIEGTKITTPWAVDQIAQQAECELKDHPDDLDGIRDGMIRAWHTYIACAKAGKLRASPMSAQKFFGEGIWKTSSMWGLKKGMKAYEGTYAA
jgi:uncharacterized protein YdaU (DUF1376 family)